MKNNKSNSNWLVKTVLCVICLYIISVSIADFSEKNSENIQVKIDDDLKNNNYYLENNIRSKNEDLLSTLKAYSNIIGYADSLDDQKLQEILRNACEDNIFLDMAITKLNGEATDIKGNVFNCADKEYFQNAVQGKSGVSSIVKSKVDNKDSIVYSTPIYKENQIVGVLLSLISVDSFQEYFDTVGIENASKTIITDKEGMVIFTGGFESTSKAAVNAQQKQLLEKNKEGAIQKEVEGVLQHVYYNIEENSNWIIFSAVEDNIVLNKKNATHEIVAILVIRLILTLGMFAYLMLYWDRQKNIQIKKQMEEMNTVLKHSPGGAVCYEKKFDRLALSFVSNGACEIFDVSREEAYKEMKRGYKHFVFEEDIDEGFQLTEEKLLPEACYRIQDKQGKIKWIYDRREVVVNEGVTYIYLSLLDITSMMELQEEIRLGEQRLRTIMDTTNLMYFDYDINQDKVFMSRGFVDFTGYDKTSLQFRKLFMQRVIHQDTYMLDVSMLLEYADQNLENFTTEEYVDLANGEKRWVRIKGKIFLDNEGNIREIMAVVFDIHEMKKRQKELEEKTRRDPLTQLYNKVSTETFIKEKLKDNKNYLQQAMFVVDVDDFKSVNDNYGHLAGDKALSELAFKLLCTFRREDIVGRIGGDEFVVFMCDIDRAHESIIEERAKQLIAEIESLSKREDGANISCSVGIAKYPQDGTTYEELFAKADEALYDIKKNGKSDYRFYQEKK